MKITGIESFRLDMPLTIPYTIAYETITSTSNVILKLHTDKGITGWGCAAPDAEVTGENAEQVLQLTNDFLPEMLSGASPYMLARHMDWLRNSFPSSSSFAAMVDMALHDLMARKLGIPLYQMLGGYREEIETSITIGIMPLKECMDQAAYYLKNGFRILKLKGGLNLEEDVEKVIKIREKLGSEFRLRFDANQGYTWEESVEFTKRTSNAEIEILEQPTSRKKEDLLGEVTNRVDIPVMADESLKTLKDAFRLASNELIDMVNIKIMKVGGILEAQHIASVAKAAGLDIMIGSIDECSMGIAAGLHFALSRPAIKYADLDGHLDLLDDPFSGIFTLKGGMLRPGRHPGLGKITL